MQAIPGAENKGEIAYNQAINKLSDLKQETLKENISVQELQKIKEKILQVIQEAKDAISQQQSANDTFTGLTFEELPQNVKAYYKSKGIDATTTAIETQAFINVRTFPDGFTIPNSITSIGSQAFDNAHLPDGFNLPSSITSIQLGVFDSAHLPDGFTLPSSVTSIGYGAFEFTVLPVGFTIPSSVTSIGNFAFADTQLPNGTRIQEPSQPNGNDLTLNSDGTWSS